ncbi:MAG: hypothetical protein IPL83_18490 [Bdellovibrionales bacterium]|nr:hypothetical protein [Bdellovibrionales bacterium]
MKASIHFFLFWGFIWIAKADGVALARITDQEVANYLCKKQMEEGRTPVACWRQNKLVPGESELRFLCDFDRIKQLSIPELKQILEVKTLGTHCLQQAQRALDRRTYLTEGLMKDSTRTTKKGGSSLPGFWQDN